MTMVVVREQPMTESLSPRVAEPGRISRPATDANRTGWLRWFPGLVTLRRYDRSWLRHDLVAGLVMTTMLLPVGIACAEASGVPGINGLYATIVPLLAYAVFGPSRIDGSRLRRRVRSGGVRASGLRHGASL